MYAMCTLYNVHKEYLFCTHILCILLYQCTISITHELYVQRYLLYTIHYTVYIMNI